MASPSRPPHELQYVSLYFGPHACTVGQIIWDYAFAELHYEYLNSHNDKTRRSGLFEPLLFPRFCGRLEGDHTTPWDGLIVRALFVDTVSGILTERKSRPWFPDESYVSVRKGDDFVEVIEESIRKMTESCDRFGGYFICADSWSSWMLPEILDLLERNWRFPGLVHFLDSTKMGHVLQEEDGEIEGEGEGLTFAGKVDGDFLCAVDRLARSERTVLSMPVVLFQSDHILQVFVHGKLQMDPARFSLSDRLRARDCVMGKMIAAQLETFRWDCALNVSLIEFSTNYVPYTPLRFLVASYSPFFPVKKQLSSSDFDLRELGADAFDPCSFSAYCNEVPAQPIGGKLMAASGFFRGTDFFPKDVGQQVVHRMKSKVRFVDWSPAGFKCGLMGRRPLWFSEECPFVDRSVCFMARNQRSVCSVINTTAVKHAFNAWVEGFKGEITERVAKSIERIRDCIEVCEEAERDDDDEYLQSVDNGEEEDFGEFDDSEEAGF